MTERMSLSQARRLALHSQGLAKVRPTTPVTRREVSRTFSRLQLVQIDSVNVLTRSHFLPFFSRLGAYDPQILGHMAGKSPRAMMEYWAHEASFIQPVHFHDLRVWQRRDWPSSSGLDAELRGGLEKQILELLGTARPLTAREVSDRIGHQESKPADNWGWNWSAVKRTLEGLFEQGVVAAAGRNSQFERRYAPLEKVLPRRLKDSLDDNPDPAQAILRLTAAAAQAHGIGTIRCFADYFRLPLKDTAEAVSALVRTGELRSVNVTGWNADVYVHRDAVRIRSAQSQALLSPFDSLVFERRRLEQLFNFHYRLEIYTPAPKRRYGYYVLPFLLGENIVARVDLKADRQSGRLLLRGAFSEAAAPAQTAHALAEELRLMARWLGLEDVLVTDNGDLAPALRAELG